MASQEQTLIKAMRRARQFTREYDDLPGVKLLLRRPNKGEITAFYGTKDGLGSGIERIDLIVAFTDGWDGMTENIVSGNGVTEGVEYSDALWQEYLMDHDELWEKLSMDIVDMWNRHEEKIEETKKKS